MHATIYFVMFFALIGALPLWEHSNAWGIGPFAGLFVTALVVIGLIWYGVF